jgi:peptidoglycan/LPS O-acetylase OafA/YrhL
MSRLLIFDLLRIVAIFLVIIAHIGQKHNISILNCACGVQDFYFVSFGGIGVTIFLIVSGAALRLSNSQVISYKKFIIKRLCRIYPAYWCSLIIILLGSAAKSHMLTLIPMDLILSITAMYAFAGEWGGPINSGSWFIGLIVILYMIYPFVAYLIRAHGNAALLALLIVSIWSRWFFGQEIDPAIRATEWLPLCRIFEFALGIFIVEKGLYPKALTNSKPIYLLSNLSFYLFLIHIPLLFVANNILIYTVLVMLSSYFIYLFDNIIIQPRLKAILYASSVKNQHV